MADNKNSDDKKDCWDKNGKGCPDNDWRSFFKLPNPNKDQFRFSVWFFVLAMVGLLVINSLIVPMSESTIAFSDFKRLVEDGQIVRVRIGDSYYHGYTGSDAEIGSGRARVFRTVPVNDPGFIELLDGKGVSYSRVVERGGSILGFLMSWAFPLVMLFVVWRFMFQRMGNMGGNVLNLGRNRAAIVAEGDTGVKFSDVAGEDEAKEELVEVVDFLKNPTKYTDIGGKIPKGVLLVGAPGTGKTLLAKAVAGEAGVPFFKISGSEFVEMFVGVGAARVRDLFAQARAKAPCIIFIDELDAIGKSRINVMGGNDEREQTLNQLLVEMDGFDSRTGVIILAATNRPEILDPALLRAGRFDRQVLVDRPDLAGREAILRIHVRGVKLDDGVDLSAIARSTPGFVGADLANLVNEAAILAVRRGHPRVVQSDFVESIEKVVAGLQKKTRLINPQERKTVAYHETGHALVAAFTPGADPVQKISIVPRGMAALGYTMQTPTEDRFLLTEKELLGKIDVLLGGRAAEEIVVGTISTGAANDLVKASDIARRMITEYGMSTRFKNVSLNRRPPSMLGAIAEAQGAYRDYSEATQNYIDEEIARILAARYEAVKVLLEGRRETLERVTAKLLEVEALDEKEFAELTRV